MASERGGARLEIRSLEAGYPRRGPVLRGVDLDAGPGEVVGILGPNGCGKSTLVRVASGVLAPAGGTVRIDDRDVSSLPRRDLARAVAVVPQETVFGFAFTALEVVLLGRHPHLAGLAFESERDLALAHAALARCGAEDLSARPIHDLSAGERQRVVFARALCQEPRLLLLDEPASFLDIRHQVVLYDAVRELARHGTTVVTVLHDFNVAAEYCDRIYLLQDGRVAAAGAAVDVLTYHNLTRVFETEVYVDRNALTGKLLVTPLSGAAQRRLGKHSGPR